MVGEVDIVIKGGRVVDGRGSVDAVTDVAIDGGRIVGVGEGFRGRRTIDARGKVVAPGFIDVHTHSDFTLPLRPSAEAKLLQGVTLDVTGNCGFSPFPLDDGPESIQHGAFVEPDLRQRWTSLGEYREALADLRPAIHVAPLVGLGAVRLAVLGSERRPPTPSELAQMESLVDAAMRDGAFGVSSGLVYAPSSYADVSELAALAAVAGRHGGFYASHIRDEADGVAEAVAEALEVGRRAGCPVQISHHKVLGRRNWGRVEETLCAIDAAGDDGLDVSLDVYPYTAGSTTLITLLPPAELSQGETVLRERLADPEFRAEMAQAIHTRAQFAPDEVQLALVPSRPELSGRRLTEAAAEEGLDPAELALRLIEADGSHVVMLGFGMAEDDVRRVLRHPRSMIGSDGWLMSADDAGGSHPRNFACTPRLLARYVRDEPVLSLSEAIRKLTDVPARRLGLSDRGALAPGMVADVVVFDLERLEEGATYALPGAHPTGFAYVLIDGQVVVEDDHITGSRPGRVLARHDEVGGT